MTAIEIIRLVGAEFVNIEDSELEQWITIVSPLVSRKRFGKLYEQAIAYLVCHKLKMAGAEKKGDGAAAGNLPSISDTVRFSSMSEGETSVSFGGSASTNASKDAEYALTSYGMQYLTLRRGVIVPITCSGEREV